MSAQLELGDVVRTTGQTLGGTLAVLFPVALVANAPTLLAIFAIDSWRNAQYAEAVGAFGEDFYGGYGGGVDEELIRISALAGLARVLVIGFGVVTTQALVLFPVVERLSGRAPTLGAALSTGIARLPAAFGALMLVSCAVMFTASCLAFPALACAVMFFFAVPVTVLEGIGPFAAVGRSVDLVSASWVKVLIVGGGVLLPFSAAGFGVRWLFDATPLLVLEVAVLPEHPPSLGYHILGGLLVVLEATILSVSSAVMYARLREEDGIDAQKLAEVFA